MEEGRMRESGSHDVTERSRGWICDYFMEEMNGGVRTSWAAWG